MNEQKKPTKIQAALLSWLGIPQIACDPLFWNQYYSATVAGQTITAKTVMQLSAVWSCVRLISETIATLPLGLYSKNSDGTRSAVTDNPIYSIIHSRPNSETIAAVFWESFVSAMLIRGNAFAEKLMVGNRLIGLKFLDPNCLTIQKGDRGQAVYKYTEGGQMREIAANRIFHVPGFSLNGKNGVSAIEYGCNVFASGQAAGVAANGMFENGLSPTVAMEYPQKLNPAQRAEARATLESLSGAANSGKSLVLENGVKAHVLNINPRDAQLLESRNFSVEEICRWFRVPPFMVGHTSNSTSWGTGIEQQMIGFLMFTLRPWLTRLEQSINANLLTPVEQLTMYAEFNVEGLLRGDSTARREFYASALQNGYMNRNQVAARENLPAIDGGEMYTVQSNLVELNKLETVFSNETRP